MVAEWISSKDEKGRQVPATTKEWVEFYIRQGEHTVPIASGEKGPKAKRWNVTEFSADDFKEGCNIGLKMDVNRGALDFDFPLNEDADDRFARSATIAEMLGVSAKLSRGRKAYTAHFKTKDSIRNEDFPRIHLQLLAKNKQTLVAPSVANDVVRRWEGSIGLTEWTLPEISGLRLTLALKAANALALTWVENKRHLTALGWKMFLLDHPDIEKMLGNDFGETVLSVIVLCLPSQNSEDHINVFKRTTELDKGHVLEQAVYVELCKTFGVKRTESRIAIPDGVRKEIAQLLPVPPAKPGCDPVEVFTHIRQFIRKRYWFKNEIDYDLCAFYVVSTYLQEVADVVPFVILTGNTVCGKTHLTNTIGLLCYKSIVLNNQTVPFIFRLVDLNGVMTMLFDEFTFSTRAVKQDTDAQDLFNLLRSSFSRGSKVGRVEEIDGERVPVLYDAFGSKGFNTTHFDQLPDDLKNRALVILCLEPPMEERHGREYQPFVDNEEARQIRAEIAGVVTDAKNNALLVADLTEFEADLRLKDIGKTLSMSAAVFGQNERLLTYLRVELLKRRSQARGTYEGELLEVIQALVVDGKPVTIANIRTIWKTVHEGWEDDFIPKPKTIASRLRRFGFEVEEKRTGAKRESVVLGFNGEQSQSRVLFDRLVRQYGLVLDDPMTQSGSNIGHSTPQPANAAHAQIDPQSEQSSASLGHRTPIGSSATRGQETVYDEDEGPKNRNPEKQRALELAKIDIMIADENTERTCAHTNKHYATVEDYDAGKATCLNCGSGPLPMSADQLSRRARK